MKRSELVQRRHKGAEHCVASPCLPFLGVGAVRAHGLGTGVVQVHKGAEVVYNQERCVVLEKDWRWMEHESQEVGECWG